MAKCPLTKQDCTVDCAWFREGECVTTLLYDVLDTTLDDLISSIDSLEQTIKTKDFQM